MQKPPFSQDGEWQGDEAGQPGSRREHSPDHPFGRAFNGSAGAPARRSPTPSSTRLEPDLGSDDDETPGRLPPGFGDLARRVAETNLLVDRAISSISAEHGQPHSAETLSDLGENLSQLFSQLYEGSADGGASPWHAITDSLGDLSAKIDRREQLRAELQMNQHAIDKAKARLIDQIQEAARVEQERLSLTRMRSRLAAVMADKLLNKLR
ncbi:MAG: hypothetical protein NBV65_01965 [Burkholderiaceae bacterium]|jgi:hypothetical protein|nr:hypothetical protein [Burkholderiaceae bacterium]